MKARLESAYRRSECAGGKDVENGHKKYQIKLGVNELKSPRENDTRL